MAAEAWPRARERPPVALLRLRMAVLARHALSLACSRGGTRSSSGEMAAASSARAVASSTAPQDASNIRPAMAAAPVSALPPADPVVPRSMPPAPACEATTRCLERALPSTYDASHRADVIARALVCLGGTAQTAWSEHHDCLPFAFGRDAASGHTLEFFVTCGDLCPHYASVGIRLSEHVSRFECMCTGGEQQFEMGWGTYVGCASGRPRHQPLDDFTLRHEADADRLYGATTGSRLEALGFRQGAHVEAIDGMPVHRPEEIRAMLERIPDELPGWVHMSQSGAAVIKVIDLHFVTREAAQELARLSVELRLSDLGTTASPCVSQRGTASIRFGNAGASYDPDCVDDVARGIARAENALRRTAREARHRSVTTRMPAEACKALEAMPRVFTLQRGDRLVELRYVDWMQR